MDIQLKARTLENALTYFERTKDPDIERMFPRSVLTREQAIANFQASLLPDADSFGQTIWADGEYVGDIWCFCIDRSQQPNAMLSLCLFAKERWGQGIGSRAVQLFLPMVTERFRLQSIVAFVYSDNLPSLHLLQKTALLYRNVLWKMAGNRSIWSGKRSAQENRLEKLHLIKTFLCRVQHLNNPNGSLKRTGNPKQKKEEAHVQHHQAGFGARFKKSAVKKTLS